MTVRVADASGAPAPRSRFLLLALLSGGLLAVRGPAVGDWFYMRLGALSLFGDRNPAPALASNHSTFYRPGAPGGLHVYATYPSIKVGPLTLVLERLGMASPVGGPWFSAILAAVLCLLCLWQLERITLAAATERDPVLVRQVQRGVLYGGVVLVLAWSQLCSGWAHLDDALVLTALCAGCWAAVSQRPQLVGLMMAVALAAKPTAVVMLPMICLLAGWRARLRSLAVVGLLAGLVWLPFVVTDLHTVDALSYPAGIYASAPLRFLLGVHAPAPPWGRPAQLVIGWLLVLAAIRLRRWPGALVLATAVRFLLEPGDAGYYAVSVVLGALLWDLCGTRRRLPLLAAATYVLLLLAPSSLLTQPSGEQLAALRAAGTLLPVLVVFGPALLRRRHPSSISVPQQRSAGQRPDALTRRGESHRTGGSVLNPTRSEPEANVAHEPPDANTEPVRFEL